MSSPVGHALAGLIFYTIAQQVHPSRKLPWAWLVVFIILAGLPDLDTLVPGDTFHRGAFHSITFALSAGLGIAWLLRRENPKPAWWLFPLAILSHPLMDMTCLDRIAPYGVQLFWPVWKCFVYWPLPFMTSVGTFKAAHHSLPVALLVSGVLETMVMGSLYMLVLWAFLLRDKWSRAASKSA